MFISSEAKLKIDNIEEVVLLTCKSMYGYRYLNALEHDAFCLFVSLSLDAAVQYIDNTFFSVMNSRILLSFITYFRVENCMVRAKSSD